MSRSPVVVRDAVEADVPALLDLWGDLPQRTGAESIGVTPEDQARQSLGLIEADPRSRAVVAEIDGEVVGGAFLRVGPVSPILLDRAVHLTHLAVAPRAVRHGVGSALLESALAWGEAIGVGSVVAVSASGDRETNRFMARFGLAQVGVVRAAQVTAMRAKMPAAPAALGRIPRRTTRTVGSVVAARRSQRRARGTAAG